MKAKSPIKKAAKTPRKKKILKSPYEGCVVHQRLTEEILLDMGWKEGIDYIGNKVFRLKMPFYHDLFQIELNPELNGRRTNPNCGILSLYHPEMKDVEVYGNRRTRIMNFPARETRIAHYVDTYARLMLIINVLTEVNLY